MDLFDYRDLFPILKEKIHLGNCSQSPQSTPVLNAMDEYLNNWRNVGMDWDFWVDGWMGWSGQRRRLHDSSTRTQQTSPSQHRSPMRSPSSPVRYLLVRKTTS